MDLVQECFPKHSRLGTAIMKYDNETDEEGEKRGVSIEKSEAGLSLSTKYVIILCCLSSLANSQLIHKRISVDLFTHITT